jgi:hypothetical protein
VESANSAASGVENHLGVRPPMLSSYFVHVITFSKSRGRHQLPRWLMFVRVFDYWAYEALTALAEHEPHNRALAIILSSSPVRVEAAAGQEKMRSGQDSAGMGNMNAMKERMQRMMDDCQQQCDASAQQCDQLASKLREARDSNDPAKMRAAIDDLIKECEQMKNLVTQCTAENHKACTEMMGMMGRMQGMDGATDSGLQMGSGIHRGMMKGSTSGEHQNEPGPRRTEQPKQN